MEKIKQLMKLISIIVLFTIPASCDLVNEQIIIEDGVNVGTGDITLTFNASVVNVTDVTGGDMDVTISNLEQAHVGLVRIGTFQTDNPGLNRRIILADVTFNKTADVGDICSLIGITVNTLKDATPEGNPISYTVEGCAIVVSALPPTTPTDPNDGGADGDGGSGIIHTPTPSPTQTSPATPSAATTPAEGGSPAETTAPTPEKVTAFHTEPSSLPPLIHSPIAVIIIVVIVAVFGIIRVLGIAAQAKDETHAEAIVSIKQAEFKKAITAIIRIVVVAVAAIIAIILMM